jgi:molybdopterin/thiamine biosynthesis adenylyltransferase
VVEAVNKIEATTVAEVVIGPDRTEATIKEIGVEEEVEGTMEAIEATEAEETVEEVKEEAFLTNRCRRKSLLVSLCH